MKNTSKFAALFVAVSMSLAPVAANASGFGVSVGDNMISWPSSWPKQDVVKQERSQFGTVETLTTFTPKKADKKEKKQ